MFSSAFHPGEFVIDDDTPDHMLVTPVGQSTGYTGPCRNASASTIPFPSNLLIPSSDWQAIIQEKEASGTNLSAMLLNAGVPSKNQQQTNYCWANSPTCCVESLRCAENQPYVALSAASVGGPITRYQNVGGNGEAALEYIVANGIVPESLWPVNAISSKYHTPANVTAALDYRIVGWYELVNNNINQLISMLLRNIPVSVGLNWWGHQVTYCDAVWQNGAIAIRFRNSWGDTYGAKGFAILQGSKMTPNDQVAPLSTIAA